MTFLEFDLESIILKMVGLVKANFTFGRPTGIYVAHTRDFVGGVALVDKPSGEKKLPIRPR